MTTSSALGWGWTPVEEEPVVAAERASRLADELAALAEQVLRVLAWQEAALGLAASGVPEPVRAGQVAQARRINRRARRALRILRDALGEQHVECDVLAEQLSHMAGSAGRPEPAAWIA